MRSCLRLYLCGVLLLLSLISKAQVRCEVIHYTAENGLSHERGTSIIKDTEGFMWAGSWDGINRFDGNSFTSYKSFPGGNTGLKNDRIDQIGEDKVGFLWLKGVDEFYRFDKKNEKFQALSSIIKEIEQQNIYIRRVTSFSKGSIWVVTKKRGLFFIPQTRSSRYLWFHKGDKNYHLPSNSVNFLHQDKQQNIWVGTEEGLACFTRTKPGHYLNKRLPINGAFSFTDFTEDDENLYFSTRQGYVVVYNKKTGEAISSKVSDKKLQAIRKSRKSPLIFCSTLSGELVVVTYPELKPQSSQVCPNVPILSIYEDRSGHLWLEPKTKGIIRFNPHNGAFKWFSQSNNGNNNISNFYSVFEDRDGTVWMSMKGGGFGYYNPSTNSIARFYQAGDVQQYKFPDIVYSVYYDEAGVIWLCTDEGIDKIILHNNQFSQHLLVENSSVVMDNQVRAVYCDSKNRLWLGSKNGHLSVLDKGRKINKPFINEPAGGFGAFYCFLQSRSGVMWIGTKYNGLFKAEPLNKEHSSYKLTHYLKSDGGLSDNDVFALMEDKAGRIWIGTFGGGLNVAVSNKDKTQFFNSKNAFPN